MKGMEEKRLGEENFYAYLLSNIPEIGNRTRLLLYKAFGSPEEIWQAEGGLLKDYLTAKQFKSLEKYRTGREGRDAIDGMRKRYEEFRERGIRFLWVGEAEYPGRLIHVPDAPFGLFVKGRLPKAELSVAVIGARDCSEYGKHVALELGRYLAGQGIAVVSGMARGIDGISQMAALTGGGASVGVLGCGVDICYPAQNRQLYESLLKQGAVISEYPPGTKPQAALFPPRNRIVSGMADALVVIEARNKSGTLITVDMALEQGKEVYVVPGRITDSLSDGCNNLIKQGAEVYLSPEAFVEELRAKMSVSMGMQEMEATPERESVPGRKWGLGEGRMQVRESVSGRENALGRERMPGQQENFVEKKEDSFRSKILSVLDYYPQSINDIMKALAKDYVMPLTSLNVELMKLCMEDSAVQVSAGYFAKKG